MLRSEVRDWWHGQTTETQMQLMALLDADRRPLVVPTYLQPAFPADWLEAEGGNGGHRVTPKVGPALDWIIKLG